MGPSTVFVALTWIVATILLSAQAAPVTDFFGPPQAIECGANTDCQDYEQGETPKVEEMERFHRTYENGTVEFKMALNNGHVQYQRISSKMVDGDKISVFEGYISEQYKDGRYGTRYYAADENGYRSSDVIIEDEPPKLPTSGPYSSSLPEDVKNHLSPATVNDEDVQSRSKTIIDDLEEIEKVVEDDQLTNLNLDENEPPKPSTSGPNSSSLPEDVKNDLLPVNQEEVQTQPKTIVDDLEEIEKVMEEDQLTNLNLGSYNGNGNSISTTESETVEHSEDPSVVQDLNVEATDLPFNLDLPSSSTEYPFTTEPQANPQPERTTLPVLEGVLKIVGAEQALNDGLPIEEDLAARKLHPTSTLDKVHEEDENTNDIPKAQNGIEEAQFTSTSVYPTKVEASTEVESTTIMTGEDGFVKTFPEQNSSEVIGESTTELNSDIPSSSFDSQNDEGSSTGAFNGVENNSEEPIAPNVYIELNTEKSYAEAQGITTGPFLNDGVTSTEPIAPNVYVELNTEKSFGEAQGITTGPFLNDGVTSTEPIAPNVYIELNTEKSFGDVSEDEVKPTELPSALIPELNEIKIDAGTSRVSGHPLEGEELLDSTTLSSVDEVSKSSDEITLAPTEQPSTKTDEDISTQGTVLIDFPTSSVSSEIESGSTENEQFSTVTSSSGEIDNDDTTTQVPKEISSVNNDEDKEDRSFDILKFLGFSKSSTNSSSSEVTEDTTNKIDEITSSSTEAASEASSTTQIVLESSSSEKNDDNITTDQPLASEENKEKSTEDEKSTEPPKESSEEDHSSEGLSTENKGAEEATITELPKESSVEDKTEDPSTSEEKEEKSSAESTSTEVTKDSSEKESSTPSVIEQSTEAEIHSTTEELGENISKGVEIEFAPPVIHF